MSVTTGVYRIRSVTDNTFIDGNDVSYGSHAGSDASHIDMNWEIVQLPENLGWTIRNVFNKKYFYAFQAIAGSRVGVDLYQTTTWDFVSTGTGNNLFWVHVKGRDVVLDVSETESGGERWMHLKTLDKSLNQLQWGLERIGDILPPGYSNQYIKPGRYTIRNTSSGTVLDLAASAKDNGTPIAGWQFHGGDNQKWELIPGIKGYRILSVVAGTYLSHYPTTNPESGIRLLAHSNDKAEWDIKKDGDAYQLEYVGTSFVLDLARSDSRNGTEVILWPNYHTANQKWTFE